MRQLNWIGILLAGLLTMICCAGNSSATVLYDSGSFEGPRFVALTDLNGQDAPPLGQGPWRRDGGSSSAQVHTNFPNGGFQSVRVMRDGTSSGDTRWGVAAPFTPSEGDSVVTTEVDMRVTLEADLDPTTPDFGPLFGIEAYDGSGLEPRLIGGVALDATTGDVLFRRARTGAWTATGTFLPRDIHHHIALSADFERNTYSILANGEVLRSEKFVDRRAVVFTDAPIFTAAALSGAESGIAYFDNYLISSPAAAAVAAIPEPAAGGIAVMAAAVLLARRRAC